MDFPAEQFPAIKKAQKIVGKNLVLRNAAVADAAFILVLRTDEKNARHLSSGDNSLAGQQTWLRQYAGRSGEAYFVIEDTAGQPLGTVRLYDGRQNSFCWGSWIVQAGAPQSVAIESALLVYAYALDVLGFSAAHFQVNKANDSVWKFHERFGAERVAEDDVEYSYIISHAAIRASLKKYARYLPAALLVESWPEENLAAGNVSRETERVEN